MNARCKIFVCTIIVSILKLFDRKDQCSFLIPYRYSLSTTISALSLLSPNTLKFFKVLLSVFIINLWLTQQVFPFRGLNHLLPLRRSPRLETKIFPIVHSGKIESSFSWMADSNFWPHFSNHFSAGICPAFDRFDAIQGHEPGASLIRQLCPHVGLDHLRGRNWIWRAQHRFDHRCTGDWFMMTWQPHFAFWQFLLTLKQII